MKLYSVRRKKDGKLSNGDKWPVFTNNGKYMTPEMFEAHLRFIQHSGNWRAYRGCEIVVCETTEFITACDYDYDIDEFLDDCSNFEFMSLLAK